MMKAYIVCEKNEFASVVVFAKTAGKAKATALSMNSLECAEFCDLEVKRAKELDCYYKDGKTEMDWDNAQDRIVLVRELGFYCEDVIPSECLKCAAKEFCYRNKESEE